MHIERILMANFRCFGPEPTVIDFDASLTAFVGANGTGKTAAFDALRRMFGIDRGDREVIPEDFHVPTDEVEAQEVRNLFIEVLLAFPELNGAGCVEDIGASDSLDHGMAAVPEFFRSMAVDDDGEMKCRIRLEATWTDDRSVSGTVEQKMLVICNLDDEYCESDCYPLSVADRGRIQMIYVPASRDGAQQLTRFLNSRLWRAVKWTHDFKSDVKAAAVHINKKFRDQSGVKTVEQAVSIRWKQLHRGTFETEPALHSIDRDFSQLARKAKLLFDPRETGHERSAEQLSDGQRSLLHLALMAATIDIESKIASCELSEEFNEEAMRLPYLTLLVVEEPENGLSPHFLSRIIEQIDEIGSSAGAQSMLSSQSASVLGRINPRSVRHFQLDAARHEAKVNPLVLPDEADTASKFVLGAVQAYPELYFASFVVLCEGSSEQIVIPRLAKACGTEIDQSFVSIVPLGGRHVHHFWKLMSKLDIQYVTLLDLDLGREGGGKGRVKAVCEQLEAIEKDPFENLRQFDDVDDPDYIDGKELEEAINELEAQNVIFCAPLDFDMSMLTAFPKAYKCLEAGQTGPRQTSAFDAVLGKCGDRNFYSGWDEEFQWYRYLFLGRSKPATHLRSMQLLENDRHLRDKMPEELRKVITRIVEAVGN